MLTITLLGAVLRIRARMVSFNLVNYSEQNAVVRDHLAMYYKIKRTFLALEEYDICAFFS